MHRKNHLNVNFVDIVVLRYGNLENICQNHARKNDLNALNGNLKQVNQIFL